MTAADQQPAIRAAVRLLAARSLTRRELIARLARRFPSHLAEAAADSLERQGLLSDRAAAESAAQTHANRGITRGLSVDRLVARGVDPALARRAADRAAGDRDEAAAALDLARRRVRGCPAGLRPDAIRRRVFAFLARRGYDEETARTAVERAVREVAPD